jgi:glycosyltransferase involved in cell wall biosynthesis
MTSTSDTSVVVPAYQAEAFLRNTLATVAAQTLAPLELIVVDDGSTDATAAVAESFAAAHPGLRVRVVRNPHLGPGATRNAGVRLAAGEWIAFLDSDDLWHPGKLERMLAARAGHPDANFFCHNETIRSLNGAEFAIDYGAGYSSQEPASRQLYRNNRFSTSAVVCRRDLVLSCGGFDEHLTSAQDYELWLRMSPDMVPVFVPEVLGTYVMRDGNISTRKYWKRLVNVLRVKHRHRRKGGVGLYAFSAVHLTLHYLTAPLRAAIKGLLG